MNIDINKNIENVTDDIAFHIYNAIELYDKRKTDKYVSKEINLFYKFTEECWQSYLDQLRHIKEESQKTNDKLLLKSFLRRLDSIKEVLFHINYFLKDILDTSIKDSPSPFLIILNEVVKRYNPNYGLIAIRFAKYNYYHIPLFKLSEVIKNNKIDDIGVIAYPFTENQTIFNNILLAHELGHFIFAKKNIKQVIYNNIGSEQFDKYEKDISEIAKTLSDKPLFTSLTAPQIWKYIWSWCEEIFCDMFALANYGLSYLLAFIKFHYITPSPLLMDKFTEIYPSKNYRIRRMTGLLVANGWEDIIKIKCKDIYEWLENNNLLSNIKDEIEKKYHHFENSILLSAYDFLEKMIPNIYKTILDLTSFHGFKVDTFLKDHDVIFKYLHELLPPPQSPRTKKNNIHPISILNSAFIFLLNNGVDILLSNSDRTINLENKYLFYKRINGLVLKSIEDHLIVERWR